MRGSAALTPSSSSSTSSIPLQLRSSRVRRVIVLGSTGSIGVQALDVVRANADRFTVVGLGAGTNREALAAQAKEFGVEHTSLGAEEAAQLAADVDADVVL